MATDPARDACVARIAESHYGYITRIEAYRAGHTETTLKAARRSRRLEPVNVRVSRVPGAPRSWQGDIYAAAMGCPSGAHACAMSAAALFSGRGAPLVPHLIVPRGSTPRGIVAVTHQWRLDPVDTTMFGIIPITRPARIVVDCARLLTGEALREAIDPLFVAQRTTRAQVLEALDRSGLTSAHVPDLFEALEIWGNGIEHDSVQEARMFRLIVGWGFDIPKALYVIRQPDGTPVCEVDAAWPQHKVALDYDSIEFHTPRRWPKDEVRAAAAVALGWTFVPVDRDDLAPGGQRRFRADLERLLPRAARSGPIIEAADDRPSTGRNSVSRPPGRSHDGEPDPEWPELRQPTAGPRRTTENRAPSGRNSVSRLGRRWRG